LNTGIVIKSTGSWYNVRLATKRIIQCRIKGKFRIKGIKSTNPVTVGDVVDFEMEPNHETGIITNIHNRKNYIVRKSVKLSKRQHIIASNIDQVFLLVTITNPPTLPPFIDRFLATAEAYHIPAILLFNKIDIYTKEELKKLKELKEIYTNIGYQCFEISATQNYNINIIKQLMKDKISMFSGHSGAGKSTLINAISPKLNLKTAAISESHKQGLHTTTFAEMFEIENNSFIIDTPGIKGFGVVDFTPEEITDYFPEFFKLKQHCKFNNCLHTNEPDCAVKNALDNNEIALSRYLSYLQILEGDDENYRVDDYAKL